MHWYRPTHATRTHPAASYDELDVHAAYIYYAQLHEYALLNAQATHMHEHTTAYTGSYTRTPRCMNNLLHAAYIQPAICICLAAHTHPPDALV
jgi:hypothetical protein